MMKKRTETISESELVKGMKTMNPVSSEEFRFALKEDLVARYAQPESHYSPKGFELWTGKVILTVLMLVLLVLLSNLKWETTEDLIGIVPLIFTALFWGLIIVAKNKLKTNL
ncbi:hypothetical protein [Algoriphagus sp. Y33]|uniref:hypothetical protein n=1 Tax=Algoriphagus sp. Y33 TaxID=2772483 RepID=UPI00177C6335|nr:hypothetical protein [Algoriphagus sp. Y33]